jgi:hypothetical protein
MRRSFSNAVGLTAGTIFPGHVGEAKLELKNFAATRLFSPAID